MHEALYQFQQLIGTTSKFQDFSGPLEFNSRTFQYQISFPRTFQVLKILQIKIRICQEARVPWISYQNHSVTLLITFCASRRRHKVYCGHARLCVCLSVAVCPHSCTDPDVTWGRSRGCPLVVHYWADLQSVH